MKLGYARVSSDDQSLEIQRRKLEMLGCEKIFQEKQSGKNAERAELLKLIEYAREGDVIYVTRVDRIARNTVDAIKIADHFAEKQAGLVCLDLGNVDINSEVGRVIYTTISAFAEMERKRILRRCNEGRALARAQGKHLGRQANKSLHMKIKELYLQGKNKRQIALELGCSRTTIYKVLG